MSILIDQNISFRILSLLGETFPDMLHIKAIGLENASDHRIFMEARKTGYSAILTNDDDFYKLLLEHGIPPKIIWLRTGNSSTRYIAQKLIECTGQIVHFLADEMQDCLEIY